MDHVLLRFLLRANVVVGAAFVALTVLFTFGHVTESPTLSTRFEWHGGLCLVRAAVDSLVRGSGTPSCWDLLRDPAVSHVGLVNITLLLLAQFCGVAAAALLLNAMTVRWILKKKK